jgi:hypothetical protein
VRIVGVNGPGYGDRLPADPRVLAAAVAAVKAYVAGRAVSEHKGQITAWRLAVRAASRTRRSWRRVDSWPDPTLST